ncbi:outer membrane protein assembly factor BamB family protein [Cellulomonas sp. URHB0016]
MRPPSLGAPMQSVVVDEVDADGLVVARPAPPRWQDEGRRLGGWAVRRPFVAAGLLAALVGLVVGVGLTAPALVTAHERRQVLAPTAFAEAVHVLDAGPAVRWSVPFDDTVDPLLVDDTVVVVAGPDLRHRSLVGLDVVTGERRWSLGLAADPSPTQVRCHGIDHRLVCAVGEGPSPDQRTLAPGERPPDPAPAVLLVVDAATGEVLASHHITGRVVATATAGGDLVVATYWWGAFAVRRIDPLTAEVRWERPNGTATTVPAVGDVVLRAGGGLVVATVSGATLVLRDATGERVRPGQRTAGTDETRMLEDGTLVRTRYRLAAVGVDVVSDLSAGDGAPWLTARGVPVEPEVSDGRSGLVFTSGALAGGPLVGRVRAYRPGASEPAWRAFAPAREIAADVGDRVVLRVAGALVGVDSHDGAQVWRRAFGLGLGDAFSDGVHLILERTTPEEGATLVALDLETGRLDWTSPLPEGTGGAVRLGGHLYAVGEGRLVALR